MKKEAVIIFIFLNIFVFINYSVFAQNGLYVNKEYGFKITPPEFAPDSRSGSIPITTFYAPSKDGFATNFNMMYQNPGIDFKEYIRVTENEFGSMGMKIISKKIGKTGKYPSVRWEYEGFLRGTQLCFITKAIYKNKRIILITGTSLKKEWEKYKIQFSNSVDSLKFLK